MAAQKLKKKLHLHLTTVVPFVLFSAGKAFKSSETRKVTHTVVQ